MTKKCSYILEPLQEEKESWRTFERKLSLIGKFSLTLVFTPLLKFLNDPKQIFSKEN